MFEIDMKIVKALSSRTRTKILRELYDKPRTLTELSDLLGFSKPTLKEHVDALIKAELIKIEKTNRKWKYFELTNKGEVIVGRKIKEIVFTLFAIVFVGLFDFGLFFLKNQRSLEMSTNVMRIASTRTASTRLMTAKQAFGAQIFNVNLFLNYVMYFLHICLIFLVVFLCYLLFRSFWCYIFDSKCHYSVNRKKRNHDIQKYDESK